jgi:NAD(P)-dependent dehydrogenase (short-subunit alcohol dehydrogenase family)
MRVAVIGASGTIGTAIVEALATQHAVVAVTNRSGPHTVDLADAESIDRLFADIGRFDAVVCAAGAARFGALGALADADFEFSLANKLMGQVNLVRRGAAHVNDGGSFTLTSGVLAQRPMPGSAAISMVNAGLEGFARAAALELPRGIRINVVSPGWVTETLRALGMDPSQGLDASLVALTYVRAIEGSMTGAVLGTGN